MNQQGSAAIWIMVLLVLVASAGYLYLQKDIEPTATESNAADLIVGTWQSLDDAKSRVAYSDDGSTEDVYDGEVLGGGTWAVTLAATADEQDQLRVISGPEEFLYTILSISETELTMSYIPRGNTLRYVRLTEEDLFNASGRAKAIEQESDLWQVYSDDASGVIFKYPHNVLLTDNPTTKDVEGLRMTVVVENVDNIDEGTLGFDRESVLANKAALESGKYGNGVDSPLSASEVLRKVGGTYAQDLVVLGRFEVCSVTFERKLYFFNNNHSVLITLYGPREAIMAESADYFTVNTENCGEEQIWDFDKQVGFYNNLKAGTADAIAQEWYSTFGSMLETLEL